MNDLSAVVTASVRLYGQLRDYHPEKGELPHRSFSISLPIGSTMASVLAELGIGTELVAGAARNGLTVPLDTGIQESDELRFFSPIAGGSQAISIWKS